MEELLKSFIGRKIDASCGTTAVFRGTVESIEGGVLRLREDDDKMLYLSVERIAAFRECSEGISKPGFIV